MKPVMAIAAVVAFSSVPAMAAYAASSSVPDPSTWNGTVDAARYAPCKEWRRNANGGWTYPGTMHMGGVEITNITLGPHGQEAVILEQRCAAVKQK